MFFMLYSSNAKITLWIILCHRGKMLSFPHIATSAVNNSGLGFLELKENLWAERFIFTFVQTFCTVCTNSNGRQTEGKRPTPLIHRDGLTLKHTMENETKIHENIYGRKTGLLGRLKYLSNTF